VIYFHYCNNSALSWHNHPSSACKQARGGRSARGTISELHVCATVPQMLGQKVRKTGNLHLRLGYTVE